MKKMWICCGVLCMAFLLFCGSAMAADLTATVTEVDKSVVSVAKGSTAGTYTVTKSSGATDGLYLVLFQKMGTGETVNTKAAPTKDNVYYMNVESASGGTVKFDAYPKDMGAGTYVVYVSDYSNNGAAKGYATITVADAPTTKYKVTVAASENGTVTADKSEAAKDETVTLTIAPAANYALSKLTVGSDDVTASVKDGKYTFTMPASDVAVSATFTTGSVPGTVVYGNVDGDAKGRVNNKDLTALIRYLNDWDEYKEGGENAIDMKAADVCDDGKNKVNNKDLTALIRHLNDWDEYKDLPYKP